MKGWKIFAAAALNCCVLQAHADGECPTRPLTAPELKWVGEAAASVKNALPPAPAGWVGINPADLELNYSTTQLATTPDHTCAEGGPYALEVSAAAFYTPRDSALAQRADIGHKRAALTRRQGSLNRSIGAANEASGAQLTGTAGDFMQLQAEMQAAQSSGDMARMQRAAEKLQKAGEAMTGASQQASDQGAADYEQSSRMQQQQMELSSKFDSLAQAAALAPVVVVTATINPQPLRARPKVARVLNLPGAAQSWVQADVQTCLADNCADHGGSAIALFGKLSQDYDSGEAVSYVPPSARAAAAQRAAMLTVEGAAAQVEPLLRAANFRVLAR